MVTTYKDRGGGEGMGGLQRGENIRKRQVDL